MKMNEIDNGLLEMKMKNSIFLKNVGLYKDLSFEKNNLFFKVEEDDMNFLKIL